MRTVQLYGTGSATASAVANVTIPSAGRIKGVIYSVAIDQVADNSSLVLELSKAASSAINTNGALDPFFNVRTFNSLVTSGMVQSSLNGFVPLDVDVRQGEVIYLHAAVTTTTYYANFILIYG